MPRGQDVPCLPLGSPAPHAPEDRLERLSSRWCELLAGYRHFAVTDRTHLDWAHCICDLADVHYPGAERIVLVPDNPTIHSPASLHAAFLPAERLAGKLEMWHTPKHVSWVNAAEIEPAALTTQRLDQRIPDRNTLGEAVAARQGDRNAMGASVTWRFTSETARIALRHLYPMPAQSQERLASCLDAVSPAHYPVLKIWGHGTEGRMTDSRIISEGPVTAAAVPVVRNFLIADVRGYTAFTNEQGVPAAARLADRFAVLCREIVAEHEGEVIELRGDEALALELAASRITLFPPRHSSSVSSSGSSC